MSDQHSKLEDASVSRAKDIPSLTVLRIFAALLVVFSHQYIFWSMDGAFFQSFVRPVLSRGDIGVKIFFILSGFILTHAYGDHKSVNKRDFFLARFARIYPMYLFGLFIALPILLLIQVPEHMARHGAAMGLGVVGVKTVCVLLLLQSWFPPATGHWNGVSWSLSTEAFFYAVFPWLMPWLRRMNDWALWLIIALGVALETVRTMSIGSVAEHEGAAFLSFFPVLRVVDFITGVAICLLHRRGRKLSTSWSLAGFAVLVAGAEIASRSFLGFMLMHVGSCLIVASLASSDWSPKNLVGRIAVLFGGASYGAYLIHQPLGYLISTGLAKFTTTKLPYPAYLMILMALCSALFIYLENPARQWIRVKFSGKKVESVQ